MTKASETTPRSRGPESAAKATTDPKQSERFESAVRDLEAAGELNRTEAEEGMERAVRGAMTANPKH